MKKAFTLIELLIVIAIIGILAGILFVNIGQTPLVKSRDAKRVADLQNLRLALSLYFANNNSYPSSLDGLKPGNYISAVPLDPRSGQSTGNPSSCTGFTTYDYRYAGGSCVGNVCVSYTMQACLERADNPVLATDADTSNTPIFDIKS